MNEPTNVITLGGIRKVFQTDEVETHALSDVHLESDQHDRRGSVGFGETLDLFVHANGRDGAVRAEDQRVARRRAESEQTV